jgi:hypothetical protein
MAHMNMLQLLFALLAVQSHIVFSRQVLQAPVATMNPPVLESGLTASSPAPAANTAAPAAANTTYPTLEAALNAANLTTLAAAIQAAGLPSNTTENVTILAPNNRAFERRLQEDLQLTPQQLLQNKTLLVEVGVRTLCLVGRKWLDISNDSGCTSGTAQPHCHTMRQWS